jgi:transposase InsO family protein
MDVGRYLVEAHLREGRSVAELARVHGVHRSWLYKLLGRYRAQGEAGLAPRSRRPHRSPTALQSEVIAEIVRLRAALLAQGLDAGAVTIQWHLERRLGRAPSVSSIVRVLRRRGLVVPQPHKRPRSSFIRFEAALPNQLWQTDATHWALADDSAVEILNIVDDHSRVLLASAPLRTVKAADAAAVFHSAAARAGYPAALLSDNAAVFSGSSRKGKVLLESELERLGIVCKHAAPYHPQTCGKVERLHQTMKRWLAKQPPAATLEELSAQLDRFRAHYNVHRPHRALGRRTPQEVFDAEVKAGPGSAVPPVHYRVRYDIVDRNGKVTLRYDSRLHHIGLGARHRGKAIVLFVADRSVRIVDTDGELLRELILDPTRDYQRQSA